MLAEEADWIQRSLKVCAQSSTWGYGQNPNRALKGQKRMEKFWHII